jgi:hypothetical protein
MTNTTCTHETSVAARLAGGTIASVWECEDCSHQRPFIDEDFAFCNAQPWTPPWKRGFFNRG